MYVLLCVFHTSFLFYPQLTYCFAKISVNRRNFYTGCVGFALGGMIGIVVGMSLHSTPPLSQRIRGVVCMDYRGLDVRNYLHIQHCFY